MEMNYKTSDFNTITYLAYCGYKYTIDRTDYRRAWFCFTGDNLDLEVERYNNHEAKVDPLKYFSVQKEIKTRLYN